MKYPILYPPDATDFFNMGQGPITTSLTATVAEDRNGSFIFEAEVLTDDAIFPLLKTNSVIKADAGHLLKDQRFKIKRIVPTSDGKATIYAEHVSYLSQELSLKPDVRFTSLNANAAIARWKSNLNETNPFVVDSDITTVGSTSWRVDKVENPRQALGGVEGSMLDVYGGEYRFDNYHISLLKKRGTTANTVLAYGRNITSLEQETNITSTYTSVYPYAKYTDDNENEQLVTIDGYTVHCANVASFPNRVVKSVDFSNEFGQGEIPTKAKLKTLAEKYITDNDFGIPSVSIRVSFLDLSKTADYADYQALEEVNLCDDVRVVFPKLGVDTVAKVTRTVWNVLSESYDEIEIGEKRASLSTIITDQTKQIEKAEENVNGAITAANGKNTIFTGLYGVDGLGEPTATRINDTWFKPNGQYVEMYTWDGTIWKFEMSTAPNPELVEAIDDVEKAVEQAKSDSNQALINSNEAVEKANDAAAKADQSQKTADQAKSDAADAGGKAQSALNDAGLALNNSNKAIGDAADALNQSALAKSQAEDAINKYLGMGMVPAWSWSADGTDRFTTVYPGENLYTSLLPYAMTGGDGWANTGTYIDSRVSRGGELTVSFDIESTVVQPTYLSFQYISLTASGARVEAINNPVSDAEINSGARVYKKFNTKADTSIFEAQLHFFPANMLAGSTVTISNIKVSFGHAQDIYTPAPSEDYANAVPSYIGFAIEPSDNPADYTWIRNPEKVEGEVKVELTEINGELQRKVSQESFNQLNGTVTNQSTLIIQNQKDIKAKADQTVVDTINQTVTSNSAAIGVNANAIKLKANQTTVDTLTGRVTKAEGSITTIAGQVDLKANKTDVNALSDTVTSLSGELSVQAGKITGLTTVTDGHTTKIGALELQAGQFSLSLSDVRNDLDGMEIGGRNYVLDSESCPEKLANGTWADSYRKLSTAIAGLSGEFEIGFDIKYPSDATSDASIDIWLQMIGTGIATYNVFPNRKFTISPGQTLHLTNKYTFDYSALTAGGRISARFGGAVDTLLRLEKLYIKKGNKATDWTPAPEDMATVTEMSNLTQTVNTIQSTVANKANQSQVTQFANQITSVVSDLDGVNSANNLLSGFTFSNNKDISITTGVEGTGSRTVVNDFIPVLPNTKYTFSRPEKIKNVGFRGYTADKTYIGAVESQGASERSTTFTTQSNCYFVKFIDESNKLTKGYSLQITTATQSQITQLSDAINLRVTKNDIINQININDQGVLIAGNKVHITGQTTIDSAVIGTAQIKDAAITDAKVGSLNAGKITAGTLDAGNVNIINLNASNIATGTISGQNLSINLITGEVMFTKGSIRNADSTFVIDIVTGVVSSRGEILSPNNTGSMLPAGFNLMNGKLQFYAGSFGETSVSYGGIMTETHSGQYQENGIWTRGDWSGSRPTIALKADKSETDVWQSKQRAVVLSTFDYVEPPASYVTESSIEGYGNKTSQFQTIVGAGMGVNQNNLLKDEANGNVSEAWIFARSSITLMSGYAYKSTIGSKILAPTLRLGLSSVRTGASYEKELASSAVLSAGYQVQLQAKILDFVGGDSGKISMRANTVELNYGGDTTGLSVGSDTSGSRVWALPIYSRTYSGSANVYVTQYGTLGRITSARKYKTDIIPASNAIFNAKKVLDIQPVTWHDRAELLRNGRSDDYYGFIADEFHQKGLKEVVVYDGNGDVEGLSYDRISIYHNVILSEHEQRINDLENEIKILKSEIEGLKAA